MIIIGSGSLLCFFLAAMIVFPQFRAWAMVLLFPIFFWIIAGPVVLDYRRPRRLYFAGNRSFRLVCH